MSQIDIIEQSIRQLSPKELVAFRDWFMAFDASEWDRQLEKDSDTGKLDKLAQNALTEHKTNLG